MPFATNSTEYATLNTFQIVTGSIAMYNSFEVLGLIAMSFQRHNSLYFWALLAASTGTIFFTGGFYDLFYHMYEPNRSIAEPLIILTLGWYGMVTGFALVLYSRLHLINVPNKYMWIARVMIAYNIVFSHFPTTTLTFGANIVGTDPWNNGYNIMEKIQMTFFSLQEIYLSALYLHFVQRMTLDKKLNRIVQQTLIINVIVVFLDAVMLGLEYANLYSYQIMMKAMVYSIKLKLEFYILNVLTKHLDKTLYGQSPTSATQLYVPSVHGSPNPHKSLHLSEMESKAVVPVRSSTPFKN